MRFTELTQGYSILNLIEHHNQNSKYVVLDLETTGLDRFKDTITDITLTGYDPDEVCLFSGKLVHLLKELTCPIGGQNIKYDFSMCYQAGVDLRKAGWYLDSMLLDHILDENQEHGLDAIVQRRYNDNYKEVFWSKYKTFQSAPRFEQVDYACRDTWYTRRVIEDISRELVQRGTPESFIEHVNRFALAIYNTEIEGVKLDLEYLSAMGQDLTQKITTLKRDMRKAVDLECCILENTQYLEDLDKRKTDKGKAGVKKATFNFDSSRQLGYLLYDQLKLPVQLNKQRNRTVDDAALERLEPRHSFIPKLREYRGHQKVFTSFIEGSLEKSRNGRIYPTFNVNGTVTGRPSSSNPNLQQLPTEGNIRGIYVPEHGKSFLSSDFGSLEVVLAAHFSQDKNLLKVVNEGVSLHDITAEGLGIPRSQAKSINFSIQYGAGAKKVAEVLGGSLADGELALKKYWETYNGLDRFMKECQSKVDRGEPIINPFGRRRHFPTKFDNFWEKQRAYRQASNSLIQGCGSDCTTISFYRIDSELRKRGIGKGMWPVHDENLTEVLDAHIEEARQIMINTMESMGEEINLTVALKAVCSGGMKRWEK